MTLAKRHQMLMYLSYKKSNLPLHHLRGTITEVPVEGLHLCVKEAILQKHVSQSRALVWEVQWYNTSDIAIFDLVHNELFFGSINSIWHLRGEIILLCNLMIIERFHVHLNSYEVSSSNMLEVVSVKNLFDIHWVSEGCKKLIPLRNHFNESTK